MSNLSVALINNLNPAGLRTDIGALWENFAIVERMKALQNARRHFSAYFWRTHQQQEMDYVEDRDGQLLAAEIKWQARKARIPQPFLKAYPNAATSIVTPDTLPDFLKLEAPMTDNG